MLFRHLRLALLWALLILVLCLMPGQDLPRWRWADLLSLDKWVHAGLFAVLMVLLLLGLKRQYGPAWARSKGLWTAAIVCILYGVALELMQGLMMQGRTADALDAAANTAGTLVGLVYLRREMRSWT